MKILPHFRNIAVLLCLFLSSIACGGSASPSLTEPPQQQQEEATSPPAAQDQAEPTDTTEPASATQESVQNSDNPSCTIVRDLNLRSGPGEDYEIKDVLSANSTVVPLGYNPNGVPGGAWLYVQVSTNQDEGWVGASSKNVSCNIDPASLPYKEAEELPQVVAALPSSVLGAPSEGGGTCGPQPDYSFDCGVVLTDETFVQFFIYQNGIELTATDGVQQVDFTVFNADKTITIYSHTESNSPYCIFGGDDQCNPWVFEDGVYKWSSGGEAVQNGTYVVSITPTVATGEPVQWEYFVDITLP